MNISVFNTPIGALKAVEEDGFLTELVHISNYPVQEIPPSTPLLQMVYTQLEEYFSGSRKEFTIPLKYSATPYRTKVLQRLLQVPFGSTVTYGQLAEITGNPKAARAVGSAMRTNPIVIIIPCHRVLPAGGKLGNYSAGGPANKDWLLTFEKQNI